MSKPFYTSHDKDFVLYAGDCTAVLPQLKYKFDMVFADPPYFLSNGGISVQSGKQVCVDKGDWDKSKGQAADTEFTCKWLDACRARMTNEGTIWVCGTFHNIFTVADALTELDFRILNAVTWQKTNPPPNLSCRFFKHSTEIVVWARKKKRVPHYFNYDLMHKLAGNKQMTDVWRMNSIAQWEKSCGKHPTQKPLALVVRAILASTREDAFILDPFSGSSTTGIAANLVGRKFVGIEKDQRYLMMSRKRREEFDTNSSLWKSKIPDLTWESR